MNANNDAGKPEKIGGTHSRRSRSFCIRQLAINSYLALARAFFFLRR
jgi:hypothetical protein